MRYQVIADDLRRLIESGELEAGQRLPAEAELASKYMVTNPTLRRALDVLQAEGLVEKYHGRGNFVRKPMPLLTYSIDAAAACHMARSTPGLQVGVTMSRLEADEALSALLQVERGTPLTLYVYISHVGAAPHSLARLYVPRDVADFGVPRSSSAPLGDDVRAGLTSVGVRVASTVERLTARPPTAEEAHTLGIAASRPVLSIQRTATDIAGRIVEWTFLTLPGDRTEAVFTSRTAKNSLEATR
ncbi:GntR family transcriptional regulator [Streptomyces chengmaiensis]|nr:GntR family transcriptional regulator [Streptomyces chengmaiensis]